VAPVVVVVVVVVVVLVSVDVAVPVPVVVPVPVAVSVPVVVPVPVVVSVAVVAPVAVVVSVAVVAPVAVVVSVPVVGPVAVVVPVPGVVSVAVAEPVLVVGPSVPPSSLEPGPLAVEPVLVVPPPPADVVSSPQAATREAEVSRVAIRVRLERCTRRRYPPATPASTGRVHSSLVARGARDAPRCRLSTLRPDGGEPRRGQSA